MKTSIFWFRQDLRIYDNHGLMECIKNSDYILPIFILDKNITPDFGGTQDKKFGFLRESLEQLSKNLEEISGVPLYIFHDTPENIIPFLIEKYEITHIYANKSYGNYGKIRDINIEKICNNHMIGFHLFSDFLLVEPEKIPQRKVFTPYFKIWQKTLGELDEYKITPFKGYKIEESYHAKDFISIEKHPYFTLDFGKKRFEKMLTDTYDDYRNFLDIDGTTRFSIYIRFGVYSIRHIYNFGKHNSSFVSELAWRDFWQHIAYYFPESKQIEFQENKRHIHWENDLFLWERFCEGKTGYPIVDACIKQLLETNWMHGRGRMIVASFLTKDLHIDWRWGEKFFKQHLLDYDENMNFGNWQWSASVGADPKPLRIFSPLLQSEKFDKNAIFIKKYIPELQNIEPKQIHNPLEYILPYYSTIVDHRIEQKRAKELYKSSTEYPQT